MKLPVTNEHVKVYARELDPLAFREAAFTRAQAQPTEARHASYIAPQAIQPSVDWWCLLRKGAGCIARCGTDIGCYATCAPGALECF